MYCDLHTHSTASDGTVAPDQLAMLAKSSGLGAIALTDHDTTDGLAQCAASCAAVGVEFVPGIEVSADPQIETADPPPGETQERTEMPVRRGTLHILGLFVRHDDLQLRQVRQRMRDARNTRNPAIVDKLRKLGIDITYQEVLDLAGDQGTSIIGRPHIAAVLVRKQQATSIQEAFRKHLGHGGDAYVRRDRLSAREAIDAIHHAGGLAIVAHPVQLGLHDIADLRHAISQLKRIGLDGIETMHTDHDKVTINTCECLAAEFDLLTSGGSDFHGSRKSVDLGSQCVPISVYERLRDQWQRRVPVA